VLIKHSDKGISLIAMIKNRKKIFLILYSILLFSLGAVVYRTGVWVRVIRPALFDGIWITKSFLKGLTARPEHIALDIPFINYQKLEYKRQEAIARGALITEDDDFVSAKINYKGQIKKIDIRLKGDGFDHFLWDKISFRVKLRKEDSLFGMRVFSLQHPQTRGYLYEWIFHEILKKEGIIYLRYDFIDVTLNGKHLGIYALEEHFEKRLIENNKRREGPILCFEEDLISRTPKHLMERISFEVPAVKLYRPNRTMKNPELYKNFITAKDLLESFRNGSLRLDQIFDCNLLARYFAILDVLGAQHAAGYGNLKLYYNPVTSLLEPIGFDAEMNLQLPKFVEYWQNYHAMIDSSSMFNKIFSDKGFFSLYLRELERLSKKSYLDNFFADIADELRQKLACIYTDYPQYIYSNDIFYRNQEDLKRILNPEMGIYAYLKEYSGNNLVLEIGTTQQIPLEILSVDYNNVTFELLQEDNLLSPAKPNNLIKYREFEFKVPNLNLSKPPVSDLKVNYRLIGTERLISEDVFPWSHLSENFLTSDFIRQKPNFEAFGFLSVKDVSIFIKKGYWDLNENLIIPAGFTVFAGEGTTLNLKNGSKILSYSNLEFIGSRDNPISIISSDGTGEGVVVINAEGDSVFEFVVFDNLSEPFEGNWHLTGAVTFYESDVKFYNSKFLNSNSEDSLNIIRSNFVIKSSIFNKAFSDCLDCDFSSGSIKDTSFIDCGDDALDFSGSSVNVINLNVFKAGDKGVSVGESSVVKVGKAIINRAMIGLASKDGSELIVENVKISNSKYGFAVYQKKSEYGPSSIDASGYELVKNVNNSYIVEVNSNLLLDDEHIPGDKEDVYKQLYGAD